MARKKIRNGKDTQYNVRCSSQEKAVWKAAAKHAGVPLSVLICERMRPGSATAEHFPLSADPTSTHQFGAVLAWLNNFTSVLRLKGVQTDQLQERLTDCKCEEDKRQAFADKVQAKGSQLVNATNLGTDREALQALTGDLIKLLDAYGHE